ncbi:MAG: hypothetical protein OXT65_04250, partial [Alphaproteobacteria bacterium]|nr:hypothetical protein [Alphaproteobacteria bacterium]
NPDNSDSSEITPPVEEETGQLIAAPKSFELDAGESRVVRLVLRKFSDDMEDIYRVRFLPDKPALEKIEELGGTSVQVNVVVSMGALIMAAPKEARPDLKFVRNDDTITFTNAGNVTAQLQREEFCTEDRKVCTPLEGQRIFPGARWIMTIPDALKDKEFSQTMLVNGSYSTLSYPAP